MFPRLIFPEMKYFIVLSVLISGISANAERGDSRIAETGSYGRDRVGSTNPYTDTYSAPEHDDGTIIAIGHFDSRRDGNIIIVNGKRIVDDHGNTNANRGTYAQGRDERRTYIQPSSSPPEPGDKVYAGSFGNSRGGHTIISEQTIVPSHGGDANANRGTYAQGHDERITSLHRSNSAPERGYGINVGSFGGGLSGDTIISGITVVQDHGGDTNANRQTYVQGHDERRTSLHRNNSAPERGYGINVGSFGSGISGHTIISDITIAEGNGGDANVNRRTYAHGSDERRTPIQPSSSPPQRADDVNVGSFGNDPLGDTIISGQTFVQGHGGDANVNRGTYAQGRDERRTSLQPSISPPERGQTFFPSRGGDANANRRPYAHGSDERRTSIQSTSSYAQRGDNVYAESSGNSSGGDTNASRQTYVKDRDGRNSSLHRSSSSPGRVGHVGDAYANR